MLLNRSIPGIDMAIIFNFTMLDGSIVIVNSLSSIGKFLDK